MKQTVNLLSDDLKPVVQRLTLLRVGVVAVSLLIILIGLGAYQGWKSADLSEQLTQLKSTQQQLEQQQTQLRQQLERRQPSSELVRRAEDLERQIDSQQALNRQLSEMLSSTKSAPDKLMSDLASIDVAGLWLTQFSITESGVSIEGKTTQANILPRWMAMFSQGEVLSSSSFGLVGLDEDEQGYQTFVLKNKEADEADNAGVQAGGGQ